MKRVLLLSLLLIPGFILAQDAKKTTQAPKSPPAFFPMSEVRRGMRAVAYTVFEGSEPKAFDLEILGVLEGFNNPKQDAVIVKLLGPDTDRTGVFAGMSGSPVYIDGKLLGAIAFAFPFSKESIGGVTPIRDMVTMFEQKGSDSTPTVGPRSFSFSELSYNENSKEFASFLNPQISATTNTSTASGPVLKPIATPLAITGIAPEIVERFSAQLQSMGLLPVVGASSAVKVSPLTAPGPETLKPGSTIVIPLMRGDFSISAAGTVTHRDGNKIYAFGHPFLSLGLAEWPMNEGEVLTVVPNVNNSFKIAKATNLVGTLRGDRASGIYGELGSAPTMIPVEINLVTSRGETRRYQYEIVQDKFLSPILVQLATLQTILGTERQQGDMTLQMNAAIKLKGQPDIVIENRLSSANAAMAAVFSIAQPVSILFNSGFSDMKMEKILVSMSVRDTKSAAKIEKLWLSKSEVKPGDTVMIHAFARTDGGGEYVERIEVRIPEDVTPGMLNVLVGDGTAVQASEPRTGFTAKTLDRLIKELNKIHRQDRLYVKLSRPDSGVLINNEELPNLPPSILATLGSDRTIGGFTPVRSATVLEMVIPPAEFVITGSKTLNLTVVPR